MGFEQHEISDVSKDIYQLARDGDLSAVDQETLFNQYDLERAQLKSDIQAELQELKDYMSIFKSVENLSPEQKILIQAMISISEPQRDGKFGPETFQKFLIFRHETGFTGNPQELVTLYHDKKEYFDGLSTEEKKALQEQGKKDGKFGPQTFAYMLSQEQGTPSIPEENTSENITVSQENTPPQTPVSEPAASEILPPSEDTVQVITEKVPGDQHPEILTYEQKIEKFIQEAKNIHPVLIKFLQEELGVTPDGAFGPKSATSAIEQFPNMPSLLEVMEKLGIPKESDALLPGGGGIESRDELRKRYGELFKILENMEGTNFPPGMIESIIRQETKYGGWKLISPTNCIGLMQLTSVAVKDMEMGYRGERYRTYFQNLPLDTVLSLPVGDTGKTIEQSIPRPIIDSLQLLHNPETDDVTYSQNIKKIERFIKADASYFNHPVNIIIGSIYLAGIYNNEGGGEVEKTAKLYNSDTAVMKAYGKAVEGFQAEIFEEGYYNSLILEKLYFSFKKQKNLYNHFIPLGSDFFMNSRKRQHLLDTFFALFDRYPREYFVFAFFGIFFFAIITKTFSYTVLDYDFYHNLAENQQIGETQIPVTRGSIYSSALASIGNGTVLSTSVDLNDIAIDPQIPGDKEKLSSFLSEIIFEETCKLKNQQECYDDLLRFLKVLEIPDFQMDENYLKNLILTKMKEKIQQTKVTSVLLRNTLDPNDEKEILGWNIAGVYPSPAGLYVNPEELKNKDVFIEKYIDLFGGDAQELLHTIRQRELRFVPIHQKLSLLSSDKIQQYVEDEQKALKEGIIEAEESIGGFIILTPRAQRIYPERKIGAQILGFIDNAGKGHYGLEGYFDDLLRGNPGEQKTKKDTQGRPIDPITFGKEDIGALEGIDIHTTIDRSIQRKVEQVLESGVVNYRANRGTVVVMDPHTGRILAMSTYPSYDPNNPGEVYELKRVNYAEYPNPSTDLLGRTVFVEDLERGDPYFYDGQKIYLREAERSEYGDSSLIKYMYKNSFGAGAYQNDAISSLYEPGSIMKTMTVAAGIDAGEIQPYDSYNDQGFLTIDTFTISNVSKQCIGYNTFTNALSFSCNVGMIRIVQKLGRALFYKYLTDFGFGELTGITLAGEISPKIEPYERWSTAKLLTSSYGLGISVTPIQMAAAYSVIANGGLYVKPYIIDTILHADGRKEIFEPQIVRRVIKEETAKKVTQMLIEGVVNGVAKGAQVKGYSVAGKTGTAQIAYKGGYEVGTASTVGSFVGFAPAEDPQFVIVVKLERPRTDIYGGTTTTRMFADIATEILKYYAIPKKQEK